MLSTQRLQLPGFYCSWLDNLELSARPFEGHGRLHHQLQWLFEKNVLVFKIPVHLILLMCYDNALYKLTVDFIPQFQ